MDRRIPKRKSAASSAASSLGSSGSFTSSTSDDTSSKKLRHHLSRAEVARDEYSLGPRISSSSSLSSQNTVQADSKVEQGVDTSDYSAATVVARPRKRPSGIPQNDGRRATWFGYPRAVSEEEEPIHSKREDLASLQEESAATAPPPQATVQDTDQVEADAIAAPSSIDSPAAQPASTSWLSYLTSAHKPPSDQASTKESITGCSEDVPTKVEPIPQPDQVPMEVDGVSETSEIQAPSMESVVSNKSWNLWPMAVSLWPSAQAEETVNTTEGELGNTTGQGVEELAAVTSEQAIEGTFSEQKEEVSSSSASLPKASWFSTLYRFAASTDSQQETSTPEQSTSNSLKTSLEITPDQPDTIKATKSADPIANTESPQSRWISFFSSNPVPALSIPDQFVEERSQTPKQVFNPPVQSVTPASSSRASSVASSAKIPASSKQHESSLSVQSGNTSDSSRIEKPKPSASAPLTSSASIKQRSAPSKKGSKPVAPNLVLPAFSDTFSKPPRNVLPLKKKEKGLKSRVGSYVFGSQEREAKEAVPELWLPKSLETLGRPPIAAKAKRIVVITTHGWFPGQLVQTVFGVPTGTSQKFANMQADALREYFEQHQISLADSSLTICPLEGEGKIQHRVQKLFDAFTSKPQWVKAIREADAIFVSTHSQGSIVSAYLINKLMEEFHLSGHQIMFLCMASISAGPFFHLNSNMLLQPYFNYLENTAAKELFDFQYTTSTAYKDYQEQLKALLEASVKVLMVGSLDDQLVPLYSSTLSAVNHPGLLRAVFIDGSTFQSADFISNLLVFTMCLRNAGVHDHSLVAQISESLAGALSGIGHSTIYEEPAVYSLAVRYYFETEHVRAGVPTEIDATQQRSTNVHYLTWSFKGILDCPTVQQLFKPELEELRCQFEDWHPTTRALRDIKQRLEPFKLIPLPSSYKSGKEDALLTQAKL